MIQRKVSAVFALVAALASTGIGCGGSDTSNNTTSSGSGGHTSSTNGSGAGATTGSGAGHASTTGSATSGSSTSSSKAATTTASTTTGSGPGGNGAGGGGEGGSSGSGGNPMQACADDANAYCMKLKTCEENLLVGYYNDVMTCKSLLTASCVAGSNLKGVKGLTDPAACTTARTATCDALFSVDTPASCEPKPGTQGNNDPCTETSQCAAAFVCYLGDVTTPGCPGYCSAPSAIGQDCLSGFDQVDSFCNNRKGEHCTLKFDPMMGATADDPACEKVIYGMAGDDCYAGTEKQCASGFQCSVMTKKCVASLEEGDACKQPPNGEDHCDGGRGLSCQLNKNNKPVCTNLVNYVAEGTKCGLVMGVQETCTIHSACKGMGTTTCVALKGKGDNCTTTPTDNCDASLGLTCKMGTCKEAPPPTCSP